MIEGYISERLEPVIPLRLRGSVIAFREVEAVIDTGFNDYLTISIELATELGLTEVSNIRVQLADGSEIETRVFMVYVEWDGEEKLIPAQIGVGLPLVGMLLLYDNQVIINVRYDDEVRIASLP